MRTDRRTDGHNATDSRFTKLCESFYEPSIKVACRPNDVGNLDVQSSYKQLNKFRSKRSVIYFEIIHSKHFA
jgi:hypothetical protein